MRLHDPRLGIDREERVERPQVARGFEDPALGGTAPLQVLELPAVRRVDPAEVGAREPGVVPGDVVGGREEHAREVVRGERDALLRQSRAHRVHRLEGRQQPVDAGEVLLDGGDARIALVGRALGWRPGMHHLPGQRNAIRGVLGEELVEDRRSGARQADDEDRPADRAVLDLGMAAADRGHAEPVLEQADEVGTHDQASEQRQPGLALERLQQPRERLAESVVAEVLEAGRPHGAGFERLRVEADDRETGRVERPSEAVQRTKTDRQHGASTRRASGARTPRLRRRPDASACARR